ncbi:hypothetical protein A9Z07_12030 [Acinetobacter sp. YK3]|nr:hypothetical protein A9Z07_12030 [Acinetobacter sp. YK3]
MVSPKVTKSILIHKTCPLLVIFLNLSQKLNLIKTTQVVDEITEYQILEITSTPKIKKAQDFTQAFYQIIKTKY